MKPPAVQALIEDLRAEIAESSVGSTSESFAQVEDATSNTSFTLTREECECVFHSSQTVRNFHEALGYPDDASVELHDLTISSDALEAVERCFTAVDET
jgi:hypothetical protein